MIERVLSYQYGDDYFYNNISNMSIGEELESYVNKTVLEDRKTIFLYSSDSEQIKDAVCGWKIHISVSLENYNVILDRVLKYLFERHIPFKVIKNIQIYSLLSQKPFPRSSYGKYITVYPINKDSFVETIQDLYELLREYKGPRVLSDRRYKDCEVLYYRYGGFNPYSIEDGYSDIKTYIYDGYNRLVCDKRMPVFGLPDGIHDVFPTESKKTSLLLEKYEIKSALSFSNTGGVYLGVSKDNSKEYIIKEARPYTSMIEPGVDAIFLRKNEKEMLCLLGKYGFTPKVHESMLDSGHFFLIEEIIKGKPIKNMVMLENPIHYYGEGGKLKAYLEKVFEILKQIIEFYMCIENEGLIFDDLSLDNVILDGEKVKIIDLEGCFKEGEKYRINKGLARGALDSDEEKQIVMKFFFDLLFPKNNLIYLKDKSIEEFLNLLYSKYDLPEGICRIFESLESGKKWTEILQEVKNASQMLEEYSVKKREYRYKEKSEQKKCRGLIAELIRDVDRLKLITPNKQYPTTPIVHNYYNILNGDTGILYAKQLIGESVNQNELAQYARKMENETNNGLYSGKYGFVWMCLYINQMDIAIDIFRKTKFNYGNDYSIFSGVSGKGLLEVLLYQKTKDVSYLEMVKNDAYYVLEGCKSNDVKMIGFSEGKAGISLFLLYAYLLLNDEKLLLAGKILLEKELENKVERENGLIDFPAQKESIKASPYFWDGTAGIETVLLRYAVITQDNDLLAKAKYYAQRMEYRQTMSPSLIYGMAGIGNTYLDCYFLLGDEEYLKNAYECAESCRLFLSEINGIKTFTDVFGLKYSCDFAFGTMGILAFFDRLVKKTKANFAICGDEIMSYAGVKKEYV